MRRARCYTCGQVVDVFQSRAGALVIQVHIWAVSSEGDGPGSLIDRVVPLPPDRIGFEDNRPLQNADSMVLL